MWPAYILFLVIIVQLTSARVISNGVPSRTMISPTNVRGIQNGRPINTNFPYHQPNNQILRNFPAKNNFAYANTAPANFPKVNNVVSHNIAKANFIANTNVGAANLPSVNNAKQILPATINERIAANLIPNGKAPLNNIPEPNINLPAENNNIANIPQGLRPRAVNLQIGTPYGKKGIQSIGVQILADNLEIAGTVSVSGRMPIAGVVAVNGNLPTDGSAAVNYGCGSPNRPVPST